MFGLNALGGWGELRATLGPEMFNLWKPLIPAGVEGTWAPVLEPARMAWYFNDNYPWVGMLFCAPIIGLWYWCTDQYIVQRTLIAPNETEARRGTIFAAFLKLLPVFIFIIPGMIALALAKSGKIPALGVLVDADGNTVNAAAQAAFPLMVQHVLPVGVRGMVVAGLLAALMSSLAGAFNASSTLFTMDFYRKFKPQASQAELVWMGRIATTVMVLIGLLWIPVIQGARGLYDYLQGVQGYLAPPIFVVFFFGVFNKRLNAEGCLSALVVGFAMGVFRLAVDTPVTLKMAGFEAGYPEGSFLWIVNHIYFQYYSLLITLVSIVTMFVVSYMSAPPSAAQLVGPHLRHGHGRSEGGDAGELEPVGRDQHRHRAGADPGGLRVLQRLTYPIVTNRQSTGVSSLNACRGVQVSSSDVGPTVVSHVCSSMTTIGPQLVIDGEVSSDDDLTIEGPVRGFVSARDGTVTIETPGAVEADVRAARVVIHGDVRGAISASERIELGAASTVEGSLSAGVIVMVDGAQFNGTIDMNRRTIAAKVAEYRAARAEAE